MNGEDRTDPILDRARQLPRDLPPAQDLWPGIRQRIAEEGSAGRGSRDGGRNPWMPAALAASVVVALGAVALLRSQAPEPPAGPVASVPAGVQATPASFGPSVSLGPGYEDARASLAGDLDERLASLTPETREVVTRNLAAIRQAVAEINAALADDPGNLFLQQLLMNTYHEELAVLANVRRMAETLPNPERNEI